MTESFTSWRPQWIHFSRLFRPRLANVWYVWASCPPSASWKRSRKPSASCASSWPKKTVVFFAWSNFPPKIWLNGPSKRTSIRNVVPGCGTRSVFTQLPCVDLTYSTR